MNDPPRPSRSTKRRRNGPTRSVSRASNASHNSSSDFASSKSSRRHPHRSDPKRRAKRAQNPYHQRPRLEKSTSEPTSHLLASPFASRASSPAFEPERPHTLTSGKENPPKRILKNLRLQSKPVLSDVLFDSNIPQSVILGQSQEPTRPPYQRKTTQSLRIPTDHTVSRQHVPRERQSDYAMSFRDRNRRPSAPSALQTRSNTGPTLATRFIPAKLAAKEKVKRSTSLGRQSHIPREPFSADLRIPITPAMPNEHHKAQDTVSLNGSFDIPSKQSPKLPVTNNDHYDWMHARSGFSIDFDRPPSQLSMLGVGIRTELKLESEHGESCPVFYTSEESGAEDNSDDDEKFAGPQSLRVARSNRYGFMDFEAIESATFGADVRDESPFRGGLVPAQPVGRADLQRKNVGQSQDRASPKDCKATMTDEIYKDYTPWISDSLISPPTALMKKSDLDDAKLLSEAKCEYTDSSSSSGLQSPLDLDDMQYPENNADNSISGRLRAVGATRTRSGTIVQANRVLDNASLPSAGFLNTRRTRSGTVVANNSLPTSAVGPAVTLHPPHTRRTRSGTVVGPPAAPSGLTSTGSNSVLETLHDNRSDLDLSAAADENIVEDVECYIDSEYLPRLSSSPDPLDFLSFARVDDCEDDIYLYSGRAISEQSGSLSNEKEMVWRVAEGPSSPDAARKRLGMRNWLESKMRSFGGRGGKGKTREKGKRLRFVGLVAEPSSDPIINSDGQATPSDDELLLKDGQTALIWD